MSDPPTGLTVNGRHAILHSAPETPLLLALRNELGLRGARVGCGIGECGACTVLLDDAPVRACITPVSAARNRTVLTPEGLGTPEQPHPVQRAFLSEQAAQCGYCINGIIMSVAAHVDGRGLPETDLSAVLDTHLCRCGAHARILTAINALGGDAAPGRSVTRIEAQDGGPPDDASPKTSIVGAEVSSWLRLLPNGKVEVRTGRVELGQGIHTALAQIVAAELGVTVEAVTLHPVDTDHSPDEGHTAGSTSIEVSGGNLAQAAVALRRLLMTRAGEHLGCGPDVLELRGDRVVRRDTAGEVRLDELAVDGPVTGPIVPTDRPRHPSRRPDTATIPRRDLPSKLSGSPGYLQDVSLPRMLHARALLPPQTQDRLLEIDVDPARALPGVLDIVVDGSFVLVIASREEEADRAVARLQRDARWETPGLPLTHRDVRRHLADLPFEAFVHRREGDAARALESAHRLEATYSKPYQVHGAMGPSCAIAVADHDVVTVWTHSQGVYPLRRELAALLEVAEEQLRVRHVDGPGCYGHNGADDAAAFAVLAARGAAGRPVRFQFTGEQELLWEPYGSAMSATLEAAYDPSSGRVSGWRSRTITDVHGVRPNGDGDRLAASWLRAGGSPRPWPGPAENGARNADPPYEIPSIDVVAKYVRGPLRTGSLRSLGAFLNVFAVESFMDELAEACGRDPLAFRLDHLADERARKVLEVAAETAGWSSRVGPSGRGQGLALARYKGTKAYVAEVVETRFDEHTGQVHVERIVIACDAGRVINADGLANQLEGGAIQGLSRTLREELGVDRSGVLTRDWTGYDVVRFSDVPRVDVVLVDRPGQAPLGAGESSTPPVSAAIANALDDATGIRMRDLPLTRDRIRDRAMQLTEKEMARVRV